MALEARKNLIRWSAPLIEAVLVNHMSTGRDRAPARGSFAAADLHELDPHWFAENLSSLSWLLRFVKGAATVD